MRFKLALLILFYVPLCTLKAQVQTAEDVLGRDTIRTITTAVPFLTISPDARSGGLAESGVALSPDANSIYWNTAKLAFAEKSISIGISTTPWLRRIINDMYLYNVSGYYKVAKERVLTGSLTYFDLGDISFTNENGEDLGTFTPKEFAITAGYAMKLSEYLGVGINLKYIHSNLTGNFAFNDGTQTKPGNTAAGDVSAFFKKEISLSGKPVDVALAGTISNVGAKISYSNNNKRDFIPTNLKLGTAITTEIDAYSKITFLFDANKLLVPSPPVYFDTLYNDDGSQKIAAGEDADSKSVSQGILRSFSDAPGGSQEELQEVILSGGIEYWYDNLLAFRGGYFHEHKFKGNRKFFTVGVGLRYQMLGIDLAYLIPLQQQHPLENTVRISLHMDFKKEESKKEESIIE